ncbi:hypothetical protein NKR19_g10158, partial [Coniochaeta hoffmannii]
LPSTTEDQIPDGTAPVTTPTLTNPIPPSSTDPVVFANLTTRDDPDHTPYHTCYDFTFTDQTSPTTSPLVRDCRQLMDNIQEGGLWSVEGMGSGPSHQHQLAQYGTCAFGVEKDGSGGDLWYYVGNQDIGHIIYQAIKQFGLDRVSAYGYMKCNAYKKAPRVKWGIYHTK